MEDRRPAQKKGMPASMIKIAKALRKEDPKKHTEGAIARRLGVARETVRTGYLGTSIHIHFVAVVTASD